MSETLAPKSRLINTRPSGRAEVLSEALQRLGVEVRNLPLLELRPKQLTVRDIAKLQHLTDYDVVVVVSPAAVELGMLALKQLAPKKMLAIDELTDSDWLAVGKKTASLLAEAGILAKIPQQASNEGLLVMPELQRLQTNDKVLLWRGEKGRTLLQETLKRRGVQVDAINFYERYYSLQANREFDDLKYWGEWVLISSKASFEHWRHLSSSRVKDYQYLVLGDRLAKYAHHLGLIYKKINNLEPKTIATALGGVQVFDE